MAPRDRPGQPGSAPLTADELVAAVRIHLDRVHDAVRRTSGLEGPAAVEVVRESALATVEDAATRSLGAAQVVGTWFRRALQLAGRSAPSAPDLEDALAALPDDARTAVLLRDAYDLPLAAVAVALGTDEDDALDRLARARLQIPAAGSAADLPERSQAPGTGSTPVRPAPAGSGQHPDLTTLARLADDHLVTGGDEAARRHVPACGTCRGVVQGQSRAARVVAALVVVGPDDSARESVVADVERAARERLPGVAPSSRVVAAVEEPTGPFALPAPEPAGVPAPVAADPPEEHRRLLSPLLVVLSVVLAALAGVGAGLLLNQRDQPERLAATDGRLPAGVRFVSPQATPPATLPSPPTVPEQRPDTDVVVVPPPPLPSPTPSPTPTPTPTPSPVAPTLGLQPPSGPPGTELAISGTGFPPGAQVRVDYLDADGEPTGSGADVVAGPDGTLSATVVAEDPEGEPGPRDVVATAGEVTARATFTVEEP